MAARPDGPPPRRTRLKVCCIADIEEARAAIAAGADALGLVSAMPSGPGIIDETSIRRLIPVLPPPIEGFVLTSLDTERDLLAQADRLGARTLQLVRELPLELHRRLASARPALRRVQVVHVEDEEAIERAAAYAPRVDALLLDSGRPSAAVAELGGTGRRHDWSISRRIVERCRALSEVPVYLAGGLDPDNVAEAIRAVRPFGIDLCSGLRRDGRLDRARLARLVEAMRRADQRSDPAQPD
ncbi:phosphoribosylanthranilate isomerase [Halomonas denitrificans]|nr:phosphoribosylanthranilate isomerase [Halomonas denitrificans]